MTTKPERIDRFRKLLGKLVQVPKGEIDRESAKYDAAKKSKKRKK